MRSRAARLTCGAVAWIAIGAAAAFLDYSERQTAHLRTAVRAFDVRAREASDVLADGRAGQQAYVAAGQGVAFWMPKVASTIDAAVAMIGELRAAAVSGAARAALEAAAARAAEFGEIDRRAREYLKSGQQLMAGDVIFTEGGEAAATAARRVEAARIAERQNFDEVEASRRKQEVMAAAAAAGLAALIVALLVLSPRDEAARSASFSIAGHADRPAESDLDLAMRQGEPAGAPFSYGSGRAASPLLKAAADLCTDLGRVHDLPELTALVTRAADVMDASGLVVWLGDARGADLRPVLAHGYSAQTVGRMPRVPRSADNAAAAAYRTGALQIVSARPDTAGALVAPLHAAEGCIGALSAELRDGGESSEDVQALATIFAAQLAGVLGAAPDAGEAKTAASQQPGQR